MAKLLKRQDLGPDQNLRPNLRQAKFEAKSEARPILRQGLTKRAQPCQTMFESIPYNWLISEVFNNNTWFIMLLYLITWFYCIFLYWTLISFPEYILCKLFRDIQNYTLIRFNWGNYSTNHWLGFSQEPSKSGSMIFKGRYMKPECTHFSVALIVDADALSNIT